MKELMPILAENWKKLTDKEKKVGGEEEAGHMG